MKNVPSNLNFPWNNQEKIANNSRKNKIAETEEKMRENAEKKYFHLTPTEMSELNK